jgi:hypothetical protein
MLRVAVHFQVAPNRTVRKFTDVPGRRAFLSPNLKMGMIKVIKMDLHGYHPSDSLNGNRSQCPASKSIQASEIM